MKLYKIYLTVETEIVDEYDDDVSAIIHDLDLSLTTVSDFQIKSAEIIEYDVKECKRVET